MRQEDTQLQSEAHDMAINKVVFDNNTLIDLTSDTVTPSSLGYGVTAHAADGTSIVGNAYTSALGQLASKDSVNWGEITGTLSNQTDLQTVLDNASTHYTYYVKGTQTASTGSWTGNLPEVEALYEGLAIDYYLPFAGSGNATLNLTLKGGTQTGAINCYYGSTSRLSTQVPQYYICRLIYQTVTINGTVYTGWYLLRSQDNDGIGQNLRLNYTNEVADSAIYRYQLLFHTDENTVTPLNNANNTTGTSKTMLTSVDFDPFGRIYFWNSTTSWSAQAIPPQYYNCYYQYATVDIRYSINCGQTLTANQQIYLKVVPQNNGLVRLASDPCWTQTLPSTADGYWYILLGKTYSTYQMSLYPEHPIYYHDGTTIREMYKWDWDDIKNKPSVYPPASHTHDDRYYTESEMDTKLNGKAASSHTHAAGDITSGTLSTARGGTGNANGTVAKLTTARTIRTNLASTSTASFDGSENITPGVTGTLPIGNGGTGNTTGLAASATKLETARSLRVNLASAYDSSSPVTFDGSAAKALPVSGVLALANGGTGGTDSGWKSLTNASVFSGTIYYRKIGIITVIASGSLTLADGTTITGTSGKSLGTLADGYAPSGHNFVTPVTSTHASPATVTIATSGNMVVYKNRSESSMTSSHNFYIACAFLNA